MTTTPSSHAPARPGVWAVDPARSTAGFTVKNFAVVPVRGTLPIESAAVTVDAAGAPVEVVCTLLADGFVSGNDKRDAHIRNPDFLDAERYPHVTFHSTAISPVGNAWQVEGLLTIKDRPTAVTLTTVTVEIGDSASRVHATGRVNRHEAGLTYGNNFGISKIAVLDLKAELIHGGV